MAVALCSGQVPPCTGLKEPPEAAWGPRRGAERPRGRPPEAQAHVGMGGFRADF